MVACLRFRVWCLHVCMSAFSCLIVACLRFRVLWLHLCVFVFYGRLSAISCLMVACLCFPLQEDNLERVRLSDESNAPTADTASLLMSLLDQLINDCKWVASSEVNSSPIERPNEKYYYTLLRKVTLPYVTSHNNITTLPCVTSHNNITTLPCVTSHNNITTLPCVTSHTSLSIDLTSGLGAIVCEISLLSLVCYCYCYRFSLSLRFNFNCNFITRAWKGFFSVVKFCKGWLVEEQ